MPLQTEAEGTGPVAVLVVTWNSAAVLPEFIASLPEGMDGLDWRLVVADNDSADDTVDLVRALAPGAVIVQTGRNAGYAAGVNAALNAAAEWDGGYRAALVCNPDIRMGQGCAKVLMDALGTPLPDGTHIGISVPLLYEEDNRTLVHSLRRESSVTRAFGEAVLGNRRAGRFPRWSELVTDPAAYTRATRADWAAGALMALSRQCLDACGLWDESFFLYSEETEYCLRAGDHGYATCLAPAARATHLGGDSRVSPRLWTLLTLNRVRLYRRRHGAVATAFFRAAVLLRETSRAALGQAPSRAAAAALLSSEQLRATPGPAPHAPLSTTS
ncbi:glycosyltransferase family 2 protein [Streptomyces sp. H10-C2]|uniref:glycosyltransferase family 2 protein n=1 Tax=unclassified Streptomyces TaxID=2593676 RepID=UPI0024BBD0A4|nr:MULTISPECIES: glycosyltransferase family 2 protein [unclassified Streptomyces]MDJ0340937.1 glycosyltransferase family 2 protein [Streptomyces sp. PH10-H1]MDJ0369831.1 glycosyltransferase family 2 protein [Streptomyces sp. H10-C2]